MKLHIYGDSFGTLMKPGQSRLLEKTLDENDYWQVKLQKKLGCDELVNRSVFGTSLDCIQYLFNQNLDEISKDDYIIVIHTEASRRWFIEDMPNLTNFASFIKFPSGEVNWDWIELNTAHLSIDKQKLNAQVQAARDYCINLANGELEDLYGNAIASYFKEFQTKGYKLINIPAFGLKTKEDWNTGFNTTGCLEQVSVYEFKAIEARDPRSSYIQITQGVDGRVAHISKVNHDILVDKIYNSFINQDDLELDVGFKHSFITEKNWDKYNDYELYPTEKQKETKP